ncbi:MAG: HD domain-containing phosphohydrolase, partial [Dehalococcoidia bacterium]
MGGYSGSRPYVRFAGVSFAVCALALVTAAYIATQLAAGWHEQIVARETHELVAEPIAVTLPQRAEDFDADLTAAAVEPLLSGSTRYVRIVSADGTEVFARGGAPESPALFTQSGLAWRREQAAGEGLFVTSTRTGAFVVEVGHDAGAVDAAITHAQREIIVISVLFTAGAWVLLQFAFWWGILTHVQSHLRLKYLFETGEQLRSSLDLHDVLTKLAADATGLAHGRFGLVALLDEDTNDLLLKTTYDRTTGDLTLHQRALDEWFIRRCIATNQTVVTTQSAGTYTQLLGQTPEIDGSSPLLCVPLAMRDRVVGAVAVLRAAGAHNYTPAEVRLVEDLASQAVAAVEQAQLFARVRSDANELENSYDTTLKVLMAALDAKDNDTEGHCERVAKLTVQLAKFMGVTESGLVDIERGALLHDVGKIGVPDAVLKQPKKLTPMEWEAMRKHPLLAGVMVSKVGFLEKALPILLYHHERYDGMGYPFGLAGENIPLEARIFSIVDAYDAMTSDRPYRAAMSHEEAMTEVRANCGSQFDPHVVDSFERLMASRPDLRDNTGHRMHDDRK